MSSMTLTFDGEHAAEIQALDYYGQMIFGPSMVEPGSKVVLRDPTGGELDITDSYCPVLDEHGNKKHRKRLSKKIFVYVNGIKDTKIYTGCWAGIAPGKELGSFTVSEAISVKGGKVCPANGDCNACKGGVNSLTLRYTGEDEAHILIKDGKGRKLIAGDYLAGEDIAIDNGDRRIASPLIVKISGQIDTKIPMNCRIPVGPGTVWSNFEVRDASSRDGGPICGCLDDDSEPIGALDYSDGPESYGIATHVIPESGSTLYIGSVAPDADIEFAGNADASGDDLSEIDDEDSFSDQPDGSIVLCGAELDPGKVYESRVPVFGSGFLNAWIDTNGDGAFTLSEQLIIDAIPTPGNNFIDTSNIVIPSDATSGSTLLRFRYSSQSGTGFDGASPDGEVEDCLVNISAVSP
ncbi:MAG: hypothetical protein KTR18_06200 [Acidiferrobacterales bacterium]|nr:hypothetical protein [Acidiferrobacterales bacterium]